MGFLSEEFLQPYPDAPEHMNELSSFWFWKRCIRIGYALRIHGHSQFNRSSR